MKNAYMLATACQTYVEKKEAHFEGKSAWMHVDRFFFEVEEEWEKTIEKFTCIWNLEW